MPKAPAREVIELHFDYKLGCQRLPFGGSLRTPSARPARRVTGKAWRLDDSLKFLSQCLAIDIMNRRRETNMIQLPFFVI